MIETTSKMNYNGELINLNFDVKNFNGNETEFIQRVTLEVSEKIDLMVNKSLNILIPFTKQIFDNEYEEKNGYFVFGEIEISDITEYSTSHGLNYTLDFSLESKQGFVIDYCNYYVMFNSNFILTSIYRM